MSFGIAESGNDDEVFRQRMGDVKVQAETSKEECLLNVFLSKVCASRL